MYLEDILDYKVSSSFAIIIKLASLHQPSARNYTIKIESYPLEEEYLRSNRNY